MWFNFQNCRFPLLKRHAATAAAKSLQSCPTLCNPTDGSPPGSSVPGILQARTLEWIAISFSNAWKWKVKVKSFSLLVTTWTAAYQAPPFMGFSRRDFPGKNSGVGCHFLLHGIFLTRGSNQLERKYQGRYKTEVVCLTIIQPSHLRMGCELSWMHRVI